MVRTFAFCLAAAALAVPAARADEKSGTDADGFVMKWLVLAPIPLGSDSGADGLGKEQVKDEGKLKPKAGDKIKIGDKELTWKAHNAKEAVLDFNAILGEQTEDSVAYAVTLIEVAEEMAGVKMKTGSDDQCKVWINGKEAFKMTDARPADKDQDTTEVTLQKGINVVVVKVVNEKVDWAFYLRFVDKDDKPVKLTAKAAE